MTVARSVLLSLGAVAALATTGCAGLGKKTVTPAQLRAGTVAVEAETPQSLAALYDELAEYFEKKGLAPFAERFRSLASKSLGSGFVVDRGGRSFIVTNRHVVDLASNAAIRLDGDGNEYPAEVVYVDPDHDIAVLRFVEEKPRKVHTFELSEAGVEDLDGVVAAGFPGMGSESSYQSTKGHVSNKNYVAKDFDGQAYVQHTAAIDPGSSGGPLLKEDGSIVGMNTLKMVGRDNVYLAIPSRIVAKSVERAADIDAHREDRNWLVGELRKSCESFGTKLNTDEDMVPIGNGLTADLIAERGMESIEEMSKTGGQWAESFLESPAGTLRYAVALRLWMETQEGAGAAKGCMPGEQDDDAGVRLSMKFIAAIATACGLTSKGAGGCVPSRTSSRPHPPRRTRV